VLNMLNIRLAQIDWLPSARSAPALDVIQGTPPRHLVLLPTASPADGTPAWDDVSTALGAAARDMQVFLAGAVVARSGTGTEPHHRGFLFAPDGRCVLETTKSLPDLVCGYGATAGEPGAARQFAAYDTGNGRVGLVIGEDVLAPQLVRATVLSGAELVLNPTIEIADDELDARLRLKAARAYENSCYLASVSPLRMASGIDLPAAAVIADPVGTELVPQNRASFVDASLDIDALRSRRNRVMPPSFPALNRTSLYAREAATRRDEGAPAVAGGPAAWREEGRRRSRERANRDVPELASSSYGVALAQTVMRHVTDLNERDAIVNANIEHALGTVQGFAGMPDVRLVVFPEFRVSWLAVRLHR
jgi:predicted amidohydrolase